MLQSKYFFVVLCVSAFTLVAPTSASATWFIGEGGILSHINSSILGDEIEAPEASEQESETKEAMQKEQEQARENAKDAMEQSREQAKQTFEIKREMAKQEMEKEVEAKKKLLKLKNQTAEYELESEDTPSGSQSSTLRIRERIKNQDGTTAEINDRTIEGEDKIEITRLDGSKVEISTTTANRLQIARDSIVTATDMPISVNDQNELILTKRDGTTRVLTILPDEAIGRLQERGVIEGDQNISQSELIEKDGVALYKISSEKQEKFFGLFRINLKKQINISAETGEVVETIESPMTKILNFFSF